MPRNREVRTLAELFWNSVNGPSKPSLLAASIGGREIEYSTEDFKRAVLSLSRHFRRIGLQPGDRVCLLAENRPEWHVVDFASHIARLVLVPLYTTLSPAQMRQVLNHSGCAAVVASPKLAAAVRALRTELPDVRRVLTLEELEPVLKEPVSESDESGAREESSQVLPDDVATIIYTSGTTGEPKGVMLTHGNITFDLQSALERLEIEGVDQALSILPLSHVLERVFCYGHFFVGARIAYGDPYDALGLLARYRPEVMACVPRILEKIHEAVLHQISEFPIKKRRIILLLLLAGLDNVGRGVLGRKPKAYARFLAPIADAVLFRKIRKKLGGRMKLIVSGGAPLGAVTAEFMYAAGVPVLEGYGMTETSPVITCNPRGEMKFGKVGPPIRGVEVKFAEDGELLTRGPHVMKGYYRNEFATAEALKDGWLHTGDLGRFDEDGYVQITGRKKELIVTAYGKNVAHQPIEAALAASPLIQNVVLLGDRRRFVSALIVPQRDELLRVAAARQWTFMDFDQLIGFPEVQALYKNEIESRQKDFADFEHVKRFAFIPETVLQDPEFLTPTQKLRRKSLERRFSAEIETMYTESPADAVSARTAEHAPHP